MNFPKIAGRLWNSPAAMSMANTLARLGGGALLMLLVLRRFPPADTAFFLLLLTFGQFQVILALILVPTFSRAVAYAHAGAAEGDLAPSGRPPAPGPERGPNRPLLLAVLGVARRAHGWLAVLVAAGLALAATPFMAAPVAGLARPADGWLAWAAFVGATGAMIAGSHFSSYLQGTGRLLLEQRWNAAFNLAAALAPAAALLAGAGVGLALAVQQAVLALGVLRARFLFRWAARQDGLAGTPSFSPTVWCLLWTPTWRSAVAPFFTAGVMQAVNLLYARRIGAEPLAAYLLGLNLIQTVAALSRAPFYSKIPELARRRALGDLAGQAALARRGMVRSHWLYVAGFLGLGLAGGPALVLLGSQTPFPSGGLWSLLGAAFFLERFAALHLQNYSVTNHILWHVVNAAYGALALGVTLLLLPAAGVAAYPWGVLAGCLGFFAWYCPRLSYRSLGVTPWAFERAILPGPALALAAGAAVFTLLWPA